MSITMFLLASSPPREIQFMIQVMITFVLNNNEVTDFVAQILCTHCKTTSNFV